MSATTPYLPTEALPGDAYVVVAPFCPPLPLAKAYCPPQIQQQSLLPRRHFMAAGEPPPSPADPLCPRTTARPAAPVPVASCYCSDTASRCDDHDCCDTGSERPRPNKCLTAGKGFRKSRDLPGTLTVCCQRQHSAPTTDRPYWKCR